MDPKQFRKKLLKDWSLKGGHLFAKHWPALYAWIVRAFIESSTGDRAVGSEFYRHIFEILEWGRRIWSDISKTDRGVVFELSFVRGVKRLYLTALHEVIIPCGPEDK
ncbi:uncharacterized protein LACBIDRAFT_301385 [Laccaria bicolor S238N-H82]|uniref:Predicted protein n=1 Tax=Laccaria bicolor (strain S238N-H82 / ATCC MYA-4686) TaxID=486041 RepID=B0CNF1_LACBS|nr:uncharacterized protein LACBIDRAFT_301385 [Laccaria bicolor S238N-H82]EDR15295.1 predicted protein [Laccaria bicolor S238N-H82]|eukprot:XP_001873503.1 predicted protein [Laccaria bicolor S238N-H82]